jgi:hypothetical protein
LRPPARAPADPRRAGRFAAARLAGAARLAVAPRLVVAPRLAEATRADEVRVAARLPAARLALPRRAVVVLVGRFTEGFALRVVVFTGE